MSPEKAEILGLMCAEDLGEMAGIFAGDGTLYRTNHGFVVEVRGNANEIDYYRNHVKPIFERAFSKELKIIKRYYSKKKGYVVGIRVCGPRVKEIFHDNLGFPIGKKSYTVQIPRIIINNKNCWGPYVRGVFDTDGSFYVRKSGPDLKYRQPIVDISSRSKEHILQIKKIMGKMEFKMWFERSNSKVRMTGWKNVIRFFKDIKPHNNKKIERFDNVKAEVAEWLKAHNLSESDQ